MKRRNAFVLILCLVALLALVGSAFAGASDDYTIPWSVIGGGGGRSTSSGYVLEGTVGQAVVGLSEDGSYQLGGGFWYGIYRVYRIYLPFIAKMISL